MKEDLAIARNSLLSLQAENAALRQHQNMNRQPQLVDATNVLDRFDPEMAETLAEERRKRQDIERELELQVCLKAETEMAMKLLEKDIHEKQDTIVSLRRQLEDIKQINLEMYRKLQVILSQLLSSGYFQMGMGENCFCTNKLTEQWHLGMWIRADAERWDGRAFAS